MNGGGDMSVIPALLAATVDQHPARRTGADVGGDVGYIGLEGQSAGKVGNGCGLFSHVLSLSDPATRQQWQK